ncbi:MAG: hypothetical protein BWZ08_01438 [candidate division BRC1 bacterium ADurb.BinA292]|nr:MAG: hypothetical protein BWZ08_01438 [candidate division BRC1 bacterium ADurb.BinA292]
MADFVTHDGDEVVIVAGIAVQTVVPVGQAELLLGIHIAVEHAHNIRIELRFFIRGVPQVGAGERIRQGLNIDRIREGCAREIPMEGVGKGRAQRRAGLLAAHWIERCLDFDRHIRIQQIRNQIERELKRGASFIAQRGVKEAFVFAVGVNHLEGRGRRECRKQSCQQPAAGDGCLAKQLTLHRSPGPPPHGGARHPCTPHSDNGRRIPPARSFPP